MASQKRKYGGQPKHPMKKQNKKKQKTKTPKNKMDFEYGREKRDSVEKIIAALTMVAII